MPKNNDPFLIPQEQKFSKEEADFVYGQEVSETFAPTGQSFLWIGKIISKLKYVSLLAFVILIFALLFGRLGYLQLIEGGQLRALADSNRFKKEIIPSSRGVIFDSNGLALVNNVPSFTLFLNSGELFHHPEEKDKIKIILTADELKTEQEAEELLNKESYLPIPVAESLPYEKAIALQLMTQKINSLKIDIDSYRNYINGENIAHLMGYLSRIAAKDKDKYLARGYRITEKIGAYGLEEYYQEELRGLDGQKLIEVDSLGSEKNIIAEIQPISGDNLYLNIDSDLQNFIAETIKKYTANKASTIIALNPQNGKVLAMISWPTFNNNEFSKGISSAEYDKLIQNKFHPLFNRAISGEYPSGSTIKLIIASAGLEENVITEQTTVNSLGGVHYDKWFFPDWKAGGHGITNVVKALAESVNTFFYYLALENFDGHHGLGLTLMLKYFNLFGLGNTLGIDLSGERGGFLPDPEWKLNAKNEAWYPGDTLHLSIGQGDLLVTPLQVAAFTAAIANKGVLYQPQIVNKMVNPSSGKTLNIQPKIIKEDIVSKNTLAIVNKGLRAGVTSGSSKNLNDLPVAVAGKTGTAQGGANEPTHAWFTGYMPFENPQISLTVLVENGGEGSAIAVPMAKEIFRWYIDNRLKGNLTRPPTGSQLD